MNQSSTMTSGSRDTLARRSNAADPSENTSTRQLLPSTRRARSASKGLSSTIQTTRSVSGVGMQRKPGIRVNERKGQGAEQSYAVCDQVHLRLAIWQCARAKRVARAGSASAQ